MKDGRPLHRAAALAARRPALVLAVTAALALAGLALALQLKPDAGIDTLVGRDSQAYAATTTYRERFGDDPIIILVRGDLTKLLLSQDLERLIGLEGCISGNAPAAAALPGGPSGPCARLRARKPVKVVFGPGTFVNEAVRQLGGRFAARVDRSRREATAAAVAARRSALRQGLGRAGADRRAKQARERVDAGLREEVLGLAVRYGLRAVPRIDDPNFVSTLVFDGSKPAGTPKRRFAYLFPSRGEGRGRAALVQVRLKPGLDEQERDEAIALIRAATRVADFRPRNGATYAVTGAPVVVSDLTSSITDSLRLLLIVALLVMAATLAVVFDGRPRLLPLAIALTAAALTFGGLSLVGASLTMASIAVLPLLIGLAVDYAIQLQARVAEEQRAGAGGGVALAAPAAVRRAALLGAPAVAAAAAATAAGFAALALSPVPMVRGFGVLLVVGIAVAFAVALVAGTAALVLAARAAPPRALGRAAARLAGATTALGTLRERAAASPPARGARRAAVAALALAVARPARVVVIAAVIAAAGWALDTQTHVQSDIQRLAPQDLPALRDLDALQRSSGVGGEVDVVVEGAALARPEVVAWMTAYQAGVLKRFGYSARRGCGQAELCPAFSLPDLFGSAASRRDAAAIEALLDAVPPYFSQTVITQDRRTATLAFGLRLMELERQKEVVDEMRARLNDGRPAGVRARLAGLPVLAADANAAVASSGRRMLTVLAGLLAVAIVLLVALRGAPRRALVPLVPIVFATGWSALVLFCLRIDLNPMSVTLGALVVAISTEFSVLLSERYRQERLLGRDPRAALARTYRATGAAVVASGATAIAGFAVLVASDIRMLRDFGFVTVVDLTVSLLGVLVVLPAVLMLAERRAAPVRARATGRRPAEPIAKA